MRKALLLLSVLLVMATNLHPLHAQESLDQVDSLLAQGYIFGARDRLEEWWYGERARAPRTELQRGIWLRGVLTVDPSMAALDFQRLVLEFPGGPYTDSALLRLARGAEMEGDLRQARDWFQALARDYPSSPHRGVATTWLTENATRVARLDSLAQAGEPAASDSATATENSPAPDPSAGAFSVQLGAFRNLDGARKLREDLRESGYDARLVRVPGSPLVRVRLGRFQQREEARELQQTLTRDGWVSTLVSDADQEEGVG